ncbi:hypothetical protein [Limnobacter sp. MED105]|uniref:hypothetical protein n=1 Tax=Limnobacter sp. MED105 TaxID=391597 RepID=UPI0002E51CBC|nr:hypothetical protein [Limnobacter sp. MED105]
MKSAKLLVSTVMFSLALGAGVAHAKEGVPHDLDPRHGGVVVESSHMEFELVLNPQATELYVRDHGKPVDLTQAKGKLVFLVAGQKMERTLAGQGALLSGEGVDLKGSGYTAVATVEFANKKKATVRFKTN